MALTQEQRIQRLVDQFADGTLNQQKAVWRGDTRAAKRAAARRLKAFQALKAYGDVGREALTVLFSHPDPEVRVMAAAYLLRYKHAEAMAILQAEGAGRGLTAFGARQAIERWNEGNWHLDPEE